MSDLTIRLTHHRKFYSDLFYKSGINIFSKNSNLRIPAYILFGFILVTLLVSIILMVTPYASGLIPLGFIGILGGLVFTAYVVFIYFRWRLSIKKHIIALSEHPTSVMHFSEKGMKVVYNQNECFYRWDYFNSSKIAENYIMLSGKNKKQMLIAAESMKKEEFEMLKRIIPVRIQIDD